MLWIDDDHTAARSLEHLAIAQGGKARIERDVPVAPKKNPQDGRERLDASAREDRTQGGCAAPRISFEQQAGDPECTPT
jgi:hypothetical protein